MNHESIAKQPGHTPSTTPLYALRREDIAGRNWHVHVVGTPDQTSQSVAVAQDGLGLGRERAAEGAGLVLGDHAVSRAHARLRYTALGVEITDLGSTNGLFVDGRRLLQPQVLHDGAVIRLGQSVLVATLGPREPAQDDLGLVGRTAAMARLRTLVRQIAPSRVAVLIEGETGTGKELIAQALHRLSKRPGQLVPLNCAALPMSLVESALFGHRRGAFTSASSDQDGAFKAAHRGTLLLDEMGDLPLEAQPKLLRVLESGEVTPVGASTAVPVDVRVIAATLHHLDEAVAHGKFRPDLLGRLAGLRLQPPPLRERRDDIALLFQRFLPTHLRDVPWNADFIEALLLHPWPRNVRELRQTADRLAALHPNAELWELEMLEPELQALIFDRPSQGDPTRLGDPTGQLAPKPQSGPPDRAELLHLLAQHNGNVSDLARDVGRSRKQVYRWLDQHGIERGEGR
jgi:DNA-binding NtrC family response regulator